MVGLFAFARRAGAQLHLDVGAQVGVMKRFLANAPAGTGDAGFGPVGEIHAHVAILPFLRAGPYLAHDISPMPGDVKAYQITTAGLRVKVTSPVPLDPWRVWAVTGFGISGAYGPSYHTGLDLQQNGTRQDVLASGAGGSFFEVPLGVGVAYRIRKPWWLTAELAGRYGFGFSGSLYDLAADGGRAAFAPGQPELLLQNPGTTVMSISLSIGVMLDM